MTMESRQPDETGSSSGLIPPATPSSPELWREILERLNEVQAGQLRLARAIESLGMIVCDALAVDPQAALSDGETTSLPRAPQRVSLAAGPSMPPNVEEQLAGSARDLAATQRTIDSLLSADVFAPAPAPAAEPTKAASTPAAAGAVTSPRYYVAPVPQESRKKTRQPVSSGAWPRGRRVARGLAREAPAMTPPSAVPNLTPAAIDALLSAEFGEASVTRDAPALRVVPATEAGPMLTALLGSQFGVGSPAPAPAPTPPPAPARVTRSPLSTAPMAPARVGMQPSGPTAGPMAGPAPSRPPQPMANPSPSPAPSRPPSTPPGGKWAPTVDPRRSMGAPTTGAPPAPPVIPRPAPAAGAAPGLVPPGAPTPTPAANHGLSAPPAPPGAQNGPNAGAGSPPVHRSPTDAASATPAPFVVPDGLTPAPPADPAVPTKPGDSAASMATEILSASPRTAVAAEPTDSAPTTLAEDVTIMAKGRRRRFRLH